MKETTSQAVHTNPDDATPTTGGLALVQVGVFDNAVAQKAPGKPTQLTCANLLRAHAAQQEVFQGCSTVWLQFLMPGSSNDTQEL